MAKGSLRDTLVFLLTNYLPRRQATRLMRRFSRLRWPWLVRTTLALWQRLDPRLDLSDARSPANEFASLHECFVRELAPGARPVDDDPSVAVSPCDGVVVAEGDVHRGQLWQLKGSPYALDDLVPDRALADRFVDGSFVTVRLRPSDYHRFHAPLACSLRAVHFVPGDTYNVNPATLARLPAVYCRNERAVLPLVVDGAIDLLLVPVAAILVASLRLHCVPQNLDARWRGPARLEVDGAYGRGEELGWFEHGSTIVVLATRRFRRRATISVGTEVRQGQPLLDQRPAESIAA